MFSIDDNFTPEKFVPNFLHLIRDTNNLKKIFQKLVFLPQKVAFIANRFRYHIRSSFLGSNYQKFHPCFAMFMTKGSNCSLVFMLEILGNAFTKSRVSILFLLEPAQKDSRIYSGKMKKKLLFEKNAFVFSRMFLNKEQN